MQISNVGTSLGGCKSL